tara:strand:+ start:2814 stop:4556 length:1743 start_codon:yes stop_codon:yes gene_type:complete
MTTRPVDITTSETVAEATDISFVFNYPIINNQPFQVRTVNTDKSNNSDKGLNGLQILYSENKPSNAVLLNKNSYLFDSFYITKGADITTGTEYEYSVIIKNKDSKNNGKYLFVVIPFDSNDNNMSDTPNDFSILKSNINTYSTDISLNNNRYYNIGNLNLNLNELIDTDETFYTYNIGDDTFISLQSGPISLNMNDPSFSQFYSEITEANVLPKSLDGTINTSSNFPINMNLNNYGSEENIYIDCSPVADGTMEQIIKPKKVYSIKPLINVKSLGDAGNALLFTFILVIVCIFCFLIYQNVGIITSGMGSAASAAGRAGSAAGRAAGSAAGSAATSAKSLGMSPLKFTIITIRTIVEPLIKSIFLRKFKKPIQEIQNIDESIDIATILELDKLELNFDETKNGSPLYTLGIITLLLVVGLFLMVIINVYTDLINMNSKEKKPKIISAKMISYGWILIALWIGFCLIWFYAIPRFIPIIMKVVVLGLVKIGTGISKIDITNKLKNIAKSVCLSIICALLFIPGFYVFGKVSTITFVSYLLFILLLSIGNFILFQDALPWSVIVWTIFSGLGAAVIFGGLVK